MKNPIKLEPRTLEGQLGSVRDRKGCLIKILWIFIWTSQIWLQLPLCYAISTFLSLPFWLESVRLIFNALIWQKKNFEKKKNPTSISVLGFLFFYLKLKKIVKSKWVERQFKCAFQKLDWFSTLWFDRKKNFEKKKKKSNFNFCSCFSFLFYLIFQKLVKSKWVVRQFKSEFQKLVKSWDSILRICNNFAIKRLSPHCVDFDTSATVYNSRIIMQI